MPSPSIAIEPSPEHLCKCGEQANWLINDSYWKWDKLFTRDRYYCHIHHNELLTRRKSQDAIRLLKRTLRDTYDSLLKARRELHKRGIKDPTATPQDPSQTKLGERHRNWSPSKV